ncbi:MAG: glycerophosphodiester phosphodiesterase [Chloroflexota bacterium]
MPTKTLRLAHRGDWRVAPENSLAALTAALALPACDGLEFDVRVSVDGVPVLYHDETLQRVHGRPDRVDAMTAAALGDLGIPTLTQAFVAIGRRAFLDVELKVDPGPVIVEILAGGRGPALSRAVVSSFDPAALQRIGQLAPSWPRWLNRDKLDDLAVADALALGCRGVAVGWRGLDAERVGLAGAAGLEVAGWTVRHRSTFDRLTALGLNAVCVEGAALDG